MNPGTLLIRADGNAAIGSGHVMRCLALAQGWQALGGNTVFAMAATTPALKQRLVEENIRIVPIAAGPGSPADLQATRAVLAEESAEWVVLDGYSFDAGYRRGIQESKCRCLIVDDLGGQNFSADLVVNQNVHASAELYSRCDPRTRILLGPRYAMLRREFAAYRDWSREIPEQGRKILVTMGGSDPNELAPRLVPHLVEQVGDDVEICVVVGGSARQESGMTLQAESAGRVRVLHDVRNMAELMAWADLAIAAAGTTSWEICCLGLPAILVEAAENQELLAQHLHERGVAVNAGPAKSVDCVELAECAHRLLQDGAGRKAMSNKAKNLVDGRGVSRVLGWMTAGIRIRRAELGDCRLLWEWANDPVVRASSFSGEPIPWESHQKWFAGQLESAEARIYIVEDESSQAVGQVRYRMEGKRATLSISVSPQFRGRGMGAQVLLRGVEELFHTMPADTIDAYVKPSNERSLELFRSAGFEDKGKTQVRNESAVWFVLQRWGAGE